MALDRDQALAHATAMIRVRRLEERCAEDYAAGKIRGFLHLYIGQEAVAAGVVPLLGPDDSILATYREHAHALLRGMTAASIFAEMYGRADGCSRGRGGSMHLFSRAHRFFGGHGIVGAGLPVAVGVALADKLRATGAIACVFFGEGAVAEGEFHEALNLASLWRLPVLFVCENNLYAMGTALARSEAEPSVARKAAAYRVGAAVVDGMDVVAVAAAARAAIDEVRTTGAPRLLECMTYRFRAHSMFDPELYRDKAEVDAWRAKCPIATFVARQAGTLTAAEVAAIEAAATAEIDSARQAADAAPLEPVADLTRDVRAP